MSVESLFTQPVTVVSQILDGTIDEYGNEIPLEIATEVMGYVQQQSRAEAEGYVPTGVWLAFLPVTTVIQADDVVYTWGEAYMVDGPPTRVYNPTTRKYSHIEATLSRTAGGLEEGS